MFSAGKKAMVTTAISGIQTSNATNMVNTTPARGSCHAERWRCVLGCGVLEVVDMPDIQALASVFYNLVQVGLYAGNAELFPTKLLGIDGSQIVGSLQLTPEQ